LDAFVAIGGQVFSRDTAGFFRDIERVFVNCRSTFARASVEYQDFSRKPGKDTHIGPSFRSY
jgi:hypothetical protein